MKSHLPKMLLLAGDMIDEKRCFSVNNMSAFVVTKLRNHDPSGGRPIVASFHRETNATDECRE